MSKKIHLSRLKVEFGRKEVSCTCIFDVDQVYSMSKGDMSKDVAYKQVFRLEESDRGWKPQKELGESEMAEGE